MFLAAYAEDAELDLQTRLTRDDSAVEVMVRYAGGKDRYIVSGNPARAVSEHPDQAEHCATHKRILEKLTAPGRVESGNEKPVGLLAG
jgi:hypothetical protein